MLRVRGGSSRRVDLATALRISESREATDPRDRVFGVSGLLSEASQVHIDYNQMLEETCIAAAVKLLESTGSVDALRPWDFCDYDRASRGLSRQIPYWARDISIPRTGN